MAVDTWIQTYTGAKVNPFDPDPDTIHIEDIAHALSNICRFTGHSKYFYSVAEHSWLVSKLVNEKYMLTGLLHDASEAYLTDVSRPVKPHLKGYIKLEHDLTKVIAEKFNLIYPFPSQVKKVDSRLCITEGKYLMPDITCWKLYGKVEPYKKVSIINYRPGTIKKYFLERFEELI